MTLCYCSTYLNILLFSYSLILEPDVSAAEGGRPLESSEGRRLCLIGIGDV